MPIQTVNPATGKVLQNYALLNEEELYHRIDAAHQSFENWRNTDFALRRKHMLAISRALMTRQEEYARLMASEMGKPLAQGRQEIEKCALVCEHYAQEAETYLAPRYIATDKTKSFVCHRPLGIVFAIMPWNFPFWQVFRFAAPTLMAGNTAILKHAPISSGTGNAIAELFLDVGFPEYMFQHFLLDNELAAKVIAHEKICAVTLTGSEGAGRVVAANAANHVKKAVLELGGSDPYVVLADADLSLAARCIVTSRLNNNGQVCISAKRIIAVSEIIESLTEKIIEIVEQYKMGDPLDPETTLGPMARKDLRQTLHLQIKASETKGAVLMLGGKIPEGQGYYYPPTVLANVHPGMPAFDEELFGPVISLIRAQNESEAISLANQTKFGLGAAVFTRDLHKGERIATHELEAGSCFVNAFVTSDPRLPFGGIKHSGFGRELAQEGILAFVNVKTVVINEK